MSVKNIILSNESILYPLLVAGIILIVSIVEHRAKLHEMAMILRTVNFQQFTVEIASWTIFSIISLYGYSVVATDGDASVLLTWGAALMLFAFILAITKKGEVSCLSPAFLAVNTVAMLCRINANTRVEAYLPTDATGDWLYQTLEGLIAFASLAGVLAWGQKPELLPVSEKTWFAALVSGVAAVVFSSQCHGDLAAHPQSDISFAVSVYLEVVAWSFQVKIIDELPRHKVNAHFLVPVAMSNMCRAFFWSLAREELSPTSSWFPDVIYSSHIILCAQTIAMLVMLLLKIPSGVESNVSTPLVKEPVAEVVQESVQPVEEKKEEVALGPFAGLTATTEPADPPAWNSATGVIAKPKPRRAVPFAGLTATPEPDGPPAWNLATGVIEKPCRTVPLEKIKSSEPFATLIATPDPPMFEPQKTGGLLKFDLPVEPESRPEVELPTPKTSVTDTAEFREVLMKAFESTEVDRNVRRRSLPPPAPKPRERIPMKDMKIESEARRHSDPPPAPKPKVRAPSQNTVQGLKVDLETRETTCPPKAPTPKARKPSRDFFPTDQSAPCYVEYKEPLLSGTSRFVPTTCAFQNGLLLVDYIPA